MAFVDLFAKRVLTHKQLASTLKSAMLLCIQELTDHMRINLLVVNTQSQNSQSVLIVVGERVTTVLMGYCRRKETKT